MPASRLFLLFALWGFLLTPAIAEPLTWRVQMFAKGEENWLSVEGPGLYADFSQSQAWTLRNLRLRGTEIVGMHGANGSVLRTAAAEPAAGEVWIGTGHGGERIESFTIVVDGQRWPYQAGRTYAGSRVVVEKQSRLGPLDHQATVVFPASGSRVIEQHVYTVVGETRQQVKFLYAFMHCNSNQMNQWLAILPDGESLQGDTLRDDGSFSLKRDVRAVVLYNAQAQTGVAYVYPKVYPGAEDFKNAIWDRKSDNKLYFRPEVPWDRLRAGDRLEYRLEVVPFSAKPEAWEAVGRRLATGKATD